MSYFFEIKGELHRGYFLSCMRIVCGNGVTLVFLNNMYPFICLEVTMSKGTVATEEYITAKLLLTHKGRQ